MPPTQNSPGYFNHPKTDKLLIPFYAEFFRKFIILAERGLGDYERFMEDFLSATRPHFKSFLVLPDPKKKLCGYGRLFILWEKHL